MIILTAFPRLDTLVVTIANAINIGMIAIFLLRTRHERVWEWRIGLLQIALAAPLLVIVGYNIASTRPWWTVVLPGLLAVFLLVELLLDYILQVGFRETRLLGPYLLLYYAALMGMIGYAFLTSVPFGFVTLATYFGQLAATAYSYRRVGHGAAPTRDAMLDRGNS